jgi:hypothetical protein
MAYKITIKGEQLIEWLEKVDGSIFDKIGDDDRIERIELNYSDDVTITIGKEDE